MDRETTVELGKRLASLRLQTPREQADVAGAIQLSCQLWILTHTRFDMPKNRASGAFEAIRASKVSFVQASPWLSIPQIRAPGSRRRPRRPTLACASTEPPQKTRATPRVLKSQAPDREPYAQASGTHLLGLTALQERRLRSLLRSRRFTAAVAADAGCEFARFAGRLCKFVVGENGRFLCSSDADGTSVASLVDVTVPEGLVRTAVLQANDFSETSRAHLLANLPRLVAVYEKCGLPHQSSSCESSETAKSIPDRTELQAWMDTRDSSRNETDNFGYVGASLFEESEATRLGML